MQNEIYYWGRTARSGTRLPATEGGVVPWSDVPWPFADIDGGFLLDVLPVGDVVYAQESGWTALSWWLDTWKPFTGRGHSTFLFRGTFSFSEAMHLAQENYPEVFDLQSIILRPYEPATGTDVPVDRSDGLTEDEGRVMDALAEAVNGYQALDAQHPSENSDFVRAIHQCQDLLAVRIARRHYPEGWPTKS